MSYTPHRSDLCHISHTELTCVIYPSLPPATGGPQTARQGHDPLVLTGGQLTAGPSSGVAGHIQGAVLYSNLRYHTIVYWSVLHHTMAFHGVFIVLYSVL